MSQLRGGLEDKDDGVDGDVGDGNSAIKSTTKETAQDTVKVIMKNAATVAAQAGMTVVQDSGVHGLKDKSVVKSALKSEVKSALANAGSTEGDTSDVENKVDEAMSHLPSNIKDGMSQLRDGLEDNKKALKNGKAAVDKLHQMDEATFGKDLRANLLNGTDSGVIGELHSIIVAQVVHHVWPCGPISSSTLITINALALSLNSPTLSPHLSASPSYNHPHPRHHPRPHLRPDQSPSPHFYPKPSPSPFSLPSSNCRLLKVDHLPPAIATPLKTHGEELWGYVSNLLKTVIKVEKLVLTIVIVLVVMLLAPAIVAYAIYGALYGAECPGEPLATWNLVYAIAGTTFVLMGCCLLGARFRSLT